MLARTMLSVLLVAAFAAAAGVPRPPSAATADVELAPDKQRRIWDLEHATFQIEQHFGKRFVAAWIARDREQLGAFLREEFAGEVLPEGAGETRQASVVREVRRSATRASLRPVDAAAWIATLVGKLDAFVSVESGRLRVLAIDAVADGAYRTRVLLGARGVGAAAAPAEYEAEQTIEIRFAGDAEIRAGRVVAAARDEREVLRTSSRPLLEEVTDRVGLGALSLPDNWKLPVQQVRSQRYQIAVEDFDRDGWPDIAVGTIEGRPWLLRSVGGRRFEDVAGKLGLKSVPGGAERPELRYALAAWIDVNDDGYPDLVLGERLYRNVEGRMFIDITARSGLRFDRVPMGALVADYDVDGDLDLYVLYLKSYRDPPPPGQRPWVGDSLSGGENALWLNDGTGRFRDVTAAAGAGGGHRQTFAGTTLFFDDDHFPDLYLANDLGINVLLRNRGDGTFEDRTEAAGAGDFATSMGVAAGDLDNDGASEIYVANMFSKMGRRIIRQVGPEDYPAGIFEQIVGSCAGNRLYTRGPGTDRLAETSEPSGVNEVGWAYAPAMVDLDGDGLLDLYATTGFLSFDREMPDG